MVSAQQLKRASPSFFFEDLFSAFPGGFSTLVTAVVQALGPIGHENDGSPDLESRIKRTEHFGITTSCPAYGLFILFV